MRCFESSRLYLAHDLGRFLECRHCTWLDLADLEDPPNRTRPDEQVLLLREKGFEHEGTYLESLRRQGLSVAEIPTDGLLMDRVEQTRAAMAATRPGDAGRTPSIPRPSPPR